MKHQNRVRRNLNPARKPTQASTQGPKLERIGPALFIPSRTIQSGKAKEAALHKAAVNTCWLHVVQIVLADSGLGVRQTMDLISAFCDLIPDGPARDATEKYFWQLLTEFPVALKGWGPRLDYMAVIIEHFWGPAGEHTRQKFEPFWAALIEESEELREKFVATLRGSAELSGKFRTAQEDIIKSRAELQTLSVSLANRAGLNAHQWELAA